MSSHSKTAGALTRGAYPLIAHTHKPEDAPVKAGMPRTDLNQDICSVVHFAAHKVGGAKEMRKDHLRAYRIPHCQSSQFHYAPSGPSQAVDYFPVRLINE